MPSSVLSPKSVILRAKPERSPYIMTYLRFFATLRMAVVLSPRERVRERG
jgi:hypothetical protein